MTALQLAFECRLIVRAVRTDPNFENVLSLLKQSSKEDLAAKCPATDASLLFYTVQRKNDAEAEKICRYLCDKMNVCDASKPDRNSQTALFFAARDGNPLCVTYLISKGCNPNHRDSALQTALFYAARDGRTPAVKALLESGADVNAVDHLGQTALFYASRDGRTDTVALMLEKGSSIVVKDRQRRTALFYAQRNNHRELVGLLKAAGAGSGSATPRQLSGAEGELPVVASDITTQPDIPVRNCQQTNRSQIGSHEIPDAPGSSPPVVIPTSPIRLVSPPTSEDQMALPPLKRRCYRLVIRGPPSSDDPEIQWISAPENKLSIFESLAPSVVVWPKTNPTPVTDLFYDFRPKWQAIAIAIMDDLTVVEGGWIFSKPVDCKAWGCPDYYEVIKNPMDYSTIKKKFKSQDYVRCSEFMADVALIFANCFRYNKPESPVASIGRNIERMFNELVVSKGIQKWLDREALIDAWATTTAEEPTSKDDVSRNDDCYKVLNGNATEPLSSDVADVIMTEGDGK